MSSSHPGVQDLSLSTLPRAAKASVLCLALVFQAAGEIRAAGTVPEEDATALPEAPAVRRTRIYV